MHHYEAHLAGRDERRNKPLVEFIYRLQVHAVGLPFMLVNQIQRCMGDKLIQMSVVFFLKQKQKCITIKSLTE